MYAAERQQRILDSARVDGRVEVAALAEMLAVTPETVRRDLTHLERLGRLRRVHGGAIPVERLGFEPDLTMRSERFVAEKERIAKAALEQVPDSGTILIDAGTTTMRLAELLPHDRELTVVTNSLTIANIVAASPNISLYMLGGRVRGRTQAAVGEWVLHSLENLYVDIAFMGTNGVSTARGLSTPDQSEAAAKRAMISAARAITVLADSSKIGVDHFNRFAALEDITSLITDAGLDEETAQAIETHGPEVVRA